MSGILDPFLQGVSLDGATREGRDWTRSFAAGRLVSLAAAFCVAPFLLVSASLAREALPVIAAVLASGSLGLLALRYYGPQKAMLGHVLGMGLMGLGVLTGLSPAVLSIAAICLGLDALAASHERRAVFAAAALFAGLSAAHVALGPHGADVAQILLALMILPLAPLVTIHLQIAALRKGAATDAARAAEVQSRDHAMLAAADPAVVIVERNGQVADVTGRVSQMLGADSAALLGRGLVDRLLISDRPAFLKAVSDAAVNGARTALTLRMAYAVTQNAAPDYAHFALEIAPAAGSAGKAAIRMNAAVALVDAPVAAISRNELLAALSHEVRTPMNAILGFTELMTNPTLAETNPARIAEYAGIVHRSARESFSVTRALVDLLRVETTPFSAVEAVDVEEALRAALAEVSTREQGGAVDVHICGVMPVIDADPRAVRMLLAALVEGLVGAVGSPAAIECTLAQHGLRGALDMIVQPTSHARRNDRTAFLGVTAELARRLAAAIGATVSLEDCSGGWRASLRFALPQEATAVSSVRPVMTSFDRPRKSA